MPPLPVSPKVKFGAFELDAATRKLVKGGIPIALRPQPFRVLLILTGRPGQVVTRDEIKRCLWGDSTFVDCERGINFSINQIRAVLCDDAEKPRYIETLPRLGYRFIATLQDENGEADGRALPSSRIPARNLLRGNQPVSSFKRLRPFLYFLLLALAVLVA